MAKLFANSGNPDQTPRSAASDLGLHCLPITLLRVSRKRHSNFGVYLITSLIIQLFILPRLKKNIPPTDLSLFERVG